MKLRLPLLWTEATLQELAAAASNAEALELHWYWEPYHQAGFRALSYAAQKEWNAARLESVIQELSCPGDTTGVFTTMDPSQFIGATWNEAGRNFGAFQIPGAFLPTIVGLRTWLSEVEPGWTPVLKTLPEFREVSDWLTTDGTLLKTFHSLGPWDQLEVIERLIGVTKSSSPLHFQRVYTF